MLLTHFIWQTGLKPLSGTNAKNGAITRDRVIAKNGAITRDSQSKWRNNACQNVDTQSQHPQCHLHV